MPRFPRACLRRCRLAAALAGCLLALAPAAADEVAGSSASTPTADLFALRFAPAAGK